jgi:hypothetical protein
MVFEWWAWLRQQHSIWGAWLQIKNTVLLFKLTTTIQMRLEQWTRWVVI